MYNYSAAKAQRHKEKTDINSTMDKLPGFLIRFNMPFIKK